MKDKKCLHRSRKFLLNLKRYCKNCLKLMFTSRVKPKQVPGVTWNQRGLARQGSDAQSCHHRNRATCLTNSTTRDVSYENWEYLGMHNCIIIKCLTISMVFMVYLVDASEYHLWLPNTLIRNGLCRNRGTSWVWVEEVHSLLGRPDQSSFPACLWGIRFD